MKEKVKPHWNEAELNVLKQYYEVGGSSLCEHYLPNRTRIAIAKQAKKLNLDYKYKRLRTWTPEELEFLKEYYPIKGSKYCAFKLNKTQNAILHRAVKLGLQINEEYVVKSWLKNVEAKAVYRNYSAIYDFTNPKIVYLLGFIWADGCVSKSVTISNVAEDMSEIITKIDLPNLMPGININYRKMPNENWKDQITVNFGNKQIIQFFKDNNYLPYRPLEPIILEKIPKHLRHYWFRGYLDGDGCIHIQGNKYTFSFTAHANSTFYFLQELFKSLYIHSYSIVCRHNPSGSRFSRATISSKYQIKRLLEYIYKDWDGIGLDRKYNKALEVLSSTFGYCK